MRRQLIVGLRAFLLMTVLLGVAYPLAITGISRLGFADKSQGSLLKRDGKIVGSSLIGQAFTKDGYFHSRPSAAGAGYDAAASGPSNLGPSSPDLAKVVQERVAAYRDENSLAADATVPVDAVTASGSGLDPHISVANANLQTARVAKARGIDQATVAGLIKAATDARSLGVLGEPGVNVLQLNLALDRLG
jgi:K+-transporting ATPase ATPase C chain